MSHIYELGGKMKVGALWIYLQGWFGAVIQFSVGVVLARILDPADFGVFYAVTAYTAILSKQSLFGIPGAMLQSKSLKSEQWNSSFWFMECMAILCTAVVFLLSDWLAGFYHDPRYASVMRLMCVNFFIMPYMSISGTLLRREMDYKTVSKIQIVSGFFGSAVGIIAALSGFGPYSLAVGGILGAILSALLMTRKAPWKPRLSLSVAALRSVFSYGWRLHLNNTLNMLANRVDNMLVGSLAGVSSLGIYNRAFNLSRMPVTELMSRLYQLIFSGLSRIQDDLSHSIEMYQKIVCAMTSSIYALLLVLVFTADGFIYLIYGEKWLPAVLPLKIMAIGSFPLVIAATLGALSDAQRLAGRETPIQIFNVVGTIIVVIVGSPWGLVGISAGISVKSLVLMVLLQRMVARSHLQLRWGAVVQAVAPAALSCVSATIAAVICVTVLNGEVSKYDWVFLVIVSGTVLIAYAFTWLMLARILRYNEVIQANANLVLTAVQHMRRKIFKPTFAES